MPVSKVELLPCPFCGGKAQRWGLLKIGFEGRELWHQAAGCKKCDVFFAYRRNGLAARMWNKRNG